MAQCMRVVAAAKGLLGYLALARWRVEVPPRMAQCTRVVAAANGLLGYLARFYDTP
jgi:hypothetical protein